MLNFDLSLQRGDFQLDMAAALNEPVTAIFGASGAGKSTLLALLAGLLAPTQGRIVLADRVLVDTRQRVFVPPHQRHIGADLVTLAAEAVRDGITPLQGQHFLPPDLYLPESV